MIELKTAFEWCALDMVRPLHLSQWGSESSFYEEKITRDFYLNKIRGCKLKQNSMPRKTEMFLEYRMYGFVPYNLSPIQHFF